MSREVLLKKKKESNFAAHSAVANFLKVCTFTLQDKAFFQRCHILFWPRSHTLPTFQYNIQFILYGKQIILTLSSFPGDLAPSDEASLSQRTAGQVMNINLRPKKCSGQSR